jgi:molybdopterin molybdotransferase
MDPALLSITEAQTRILAACAPLSPEWVPLEEALGRALLEPVVARFTQPPWDNSAMDGYAVRAVDAQSPGARLRVVEAIYAGHTPTRALGPGEAARIMTGAPLPGGATAVVMQERTRALDGPGLGEVEVLESVPPDANVRPAGEDAKAGEVLLAEGTALGIPELGLLWGQGLTGVSVPRRPQVAILATGDELCRPDAHRAGLIVDTNSPSLALAVRRAGGVPHLVGIARDTLQDVERLLTPALESDVVLTSAGMSVGEKDFVRRAFDQLGVKSDFWGVAIRPGKPLAFARRGRTLVFGLPGNPTSSLVDFELFVRPALRRLVGQTNVLPAPVVGRSAVELRKRTGLAHLVRVQATFREGELWAEPLATQTSGAVRSASAATHLLHFPINAISLGRGDVAQLFPVSWGPSAT